MPNDKEQARKTFTANAIDLKCTSFLQTDMSITSRAQSLKMWTCESVTFITVTDTRGKQFQGGKTDF